MNNVIETTVAKTKKGAEIVSLNENKNVTENITEPTLQDKKHADYIEYKLMVDKAQSDFETKRHNLDGGLQIAENLLNFINNDAKWVSAEALGVIEVVKTLEEQIKEIKAKKQKNVFLQVLPIEAIHYFLKKAENTGYEKAKQYMEIYEPIAQLMQKVNQEYSNLQNLQFNLANLEQGLLSKEEIDQTTQPSTTETPLTDYAAENYGSDA